MNEEPNSPFGRDEMDELGALVFYVILAMVAIVVGIKFLL